MASSELRLIVARWHHVRVRDFLTVVFRHVGKDTKATRQQISDDEYINKYIETNLAFLRSIQILVGIGWIVKKNLFAIIRQFRKPTVFLTVSANGMICFKRFLEKKTTTTKTTTTTTLVNLWCSYMC